MPVFEGLVDPNGNVVRNRGDFSVVSKQNNLLILDFAQDVGNAYCLASAWRADGDIGPSPVTVGPQPSNQDQYLFAVEDYYGVSFRLDNDPDPGQAVTVLGGYVEPATPPRTKDWFAWNNLQPPGPNFFHIIGDVEVPNPGVDPILTYRVPQGVNPNHIQLVLTLRQLPGIWPQIVAWKQVRYDRVLTENKYSVAEVFYAGNLIESVQVVDVS